MHVEDQMGNTIHLPNPPRRIISLVPSQTELLFDLDLDEEIVGVTTFCVHPKEKCAAKAVVGGTKQFNFERIDELQPDLIIGNKEENYEKGIERLREKYPVWMSDVITLADAYLMIEMIGTIVRRPDTAAGLVLRIREGIDGLPPWPRLRVAYLIWRKPYMVAGHRTFVHEMLHKAGFINVFGHLPRYPEVSAAQIRQAKPDVLLLASEPFPFSEKFLPEFDMRFPEIPAALVDGQIFSWYGSRLLKAPGYFQKLRRRLKPYVSPLPLPLEPDQDDDSPLVSP